MPILSCVWYMAMLPSPGKPDWSIGILPPAACAAAADEFSNDVTFICLTFQQSVEIISLSVRLHRLFVAVPTARRQKEKNKNTARGRSADSTRAQTSNKTRFRNLTASSLK